MKYIKIGIDTAMLIFLPLLMAYSLSLYGLCLYKRAENAETTEKRNFKR